MAFPDLQEMIISVPGVVIGFAFHEFAHAWTATWFGDDTPRRQGRVTLNPLVHLDPLGTILLLLFGFGWARPVEVNVEKMRPRVVGDIVVSLAGVTMNFLLACLFMFLESLARRGKLGYSHPLFAETLMQTAILNGFLVAINILPVPPLDGFRVVQYLLPNRQLVEKLYRYGPILLILLFATDVADAVIYPVMTAVLMAAVEVAAPLARAVLYGGA